MKKKEITLMRHDPGHCLAPGLFQSFKRGAKEGKGLDVTYRYNERTTLRFMGAKQLGANNMRVLQGIGAVTGEEVKTIDLSDPRSEAAKQLTLLLEPREEALREKSAAVRTTLQKLMREIGYKSDGGKNREEVLENLLELSTVTIVAKHDKKQWVTHLLSYYVDEKTGELVLMVNPRMTKAIMGQDRFTHIDMREVRALESDPARLLHQRLCAVVDPGKDQKFLVDTLLSYIWPEPAEGATLRKRRQVLRAAFKELEATKGWLISEDPSGMFLIHRQKVGYPTAAKEDSRQAEFV